MNTSDCLACTVDPAQCKDCPECGFGKSETTSTLMLYLAQTNCQVRLTEYFLWERGCLSLKSSPFSLRILCYVICSGHRGRNNPVVNFEGWTEEGPKTFNPGEQRLGTLLKMSQLQYFKIAIFKVDFFNKTTLNPQTKLGELILDIFSRRLLFFKKKLKIYHMWVLVYLIFFLIPLPKEKRKILQTHLNEICHIHILIKRTA